MKSWNPETSERGGMIENGDWWVCAFGANVKFLALLHKPVLKNGRCLLSLMPCLNAQFWISNLFFFYVYVITLLIHRTAEYPHVYITN